MITATLIMLNDVHGTVSLESGRNAWESALSGLVPYYNHAGAKGMVIIDGADVARFTQNECHEIFATHKRLMQLRSKGTKVVPKPKQQLEPDLIDVWLDFDDLKWAVQLKTKDEKLIKTTYHDTRKEALMVAEAHPVPIRVFNNDHSAHVRRVKHIPKEFKK